MSLGHKYVCTAHRGGGIEQNFNMPLVHFAHSCKALHQALLSSSRQGERWRAGVMTHLPSLAFWMVIICHKAKTQPAPSQELLSSSQHAYATPRTFLALARAPVCCTEHSDVTLRVLCTCRARGLTGPLLVEVPKAVAVDATELPHFGLEVTYDHGTSLVGGAEQPGRIQKRLLLLN